jgi:preprotein translocase subunit YajC
LESLLLFAVIPVLFYVILLRPDQQRRKKIQELIENLKAGDKIVTTGGLFGTVVGVKGTRIQVKLGENVKVEMSRDAVTGLQDSDDKE